jgi:hypothetical protein
MTWKSTATTQYRQARLLNNSRTKLLHNQCAHANADENHSFTVPAIGFASLAGFDRSLIKRKGLTYTRVAYKFINILVEDRLWDQLRGITWRIGNCGCLYLLWKA